MTPQEQQVTDNELIAKFMGFTKIEDDVIWMTVPKEYHKYSTSPLGHYMHADTQLKFDISWDWLMPVVEKIAAQWGNKDPKNDFGLWASRVTVVTMIPIGTPRKEVYKEIVEFIKWYNQQKP